MTTQEVLKKLNTIFQDEFDDENIQVTETTTANDIEDWDSLTHISLIAAIEDEFDMEFTMGEVTSMKNVGEMAEIIISRIS